MVLSSLLLLLLLLLLMLLLLLLLLHLLLEENRCGDANPAPLLPASVSENPRKDTAKANPDSDSSRINQRTTTTGPSRMRTNVSAVCDHKMGL